MNIQVLLFASYADAFRASHVDVTLTTGSTVGDLLTRVKQLAAGHALPPAPLVALNARYATLDEVIQPGDQVALIPPVAGG